MLQRERLAAKFVLLSIAPRFSTFTEVSNVSGLKLPAKELAAMGSPPRHLLPRGRGAQSWEAATLDVHDIGCDPFAASVHKQFMGLKEVGILYVRA